VIASNTTLTSSPSPGPDGRTWTITALVWDDKRGEERLFAGLTTDNGLVREKITTAMLVHGA
jgi:hypothetical protein